jgi:hypothetical protein
MANRRISTRRVKSRLTYTVAQAARIVDVHENTIRAWLAEGLETVGGNGRTLIFGAAIIEFVDKRRINRKRPCDVGEIYCVKCRAPKKPAYKMADIFQEKNGVGRLEGLCPSCGTMIYRRVNLSKIEAIKGDLDVRMPLRSPRLCEPRNLAFNCDSSLGALKDD